MRALKHRIPIKRGTLSRLFGAATTQSDLGKGKIPIFIISFNRKWQLERAIKSYTALGNVDLITHDNGSDDRAVIDYLAKLERSGVTVYRYPKIKDKTDLKNVNLSIDKYFTEHPISNYIVTDPDIELVHPTHNTLDLYNYLLRLDRKIDSVGPMLKIDDIPREYPLYNKVLNRHIEQFWGRKPTLIQYGQQKVAFLRCRIDTTFAMHRAGTTFKRLTDGARLYGQYSARHLDWYNKNIVKDSYFTKSNPKVAHWGSRDFYRAFKGDKLRHNRYFDIAEDASGLVVVEKRLHE